MSLIVEGHPFWGCDMKLRSAQRNLDALHDAITRFHKSEPYETFIKGSFKTGHYQVVATGVKSMPVLRWGAIIGDVVHDLRSCLDHIIWTLSINRMGFAPPYPIPSSSPWRTIGFPIYRDPDAFSRMNKRGRPGGGGGYEKLWAVRPVTRLYVKRMQPFKRRQPELDPLWMLHELSNIDKHQSIHLSGITMNVPEVTAPWAERIESVEVNFGRPFIGDAVLSHFIVHPPEAALHMNMRGLFAFDIVFDEGPPGFGLSVMQTLREIRDRVEMIVDDLTTHLFGPEWTTNDWPTMRL
jgi:hypothetical protein